MPYGAAVSRIRRPHCRPRAKCFVGLLLLDLVFGLGCTDLSDPDHAEILGANGIFFDARDRLYVASVYSGGIWVLDRETGATQQILAEEHGVLSPDDVTIDAAGTVYFTNILHGTVSSLSADGTVREIADLGLGVNSITVSPDDTLWIGRDFLGDGLYELDPTGAKPPRTVIAEPGWINAMDFGPDGMLYGPVYTQSIVVRIDPVTGEMSTVADGFETKLHAVKFDHAGRLHVLESQPGRVIRIDLASGERTVLGRYEPGFDNLAFDSSDRLFVSSHADGSVHEVMKDTTLRTVRAPSELASWVVLTFTVLLPIATLLLLLGLVTTLRWFWLRQRMRAKARAGP